MTKTTVKYRVVIRRKGAKKWNVRHHSTKQKVVTFVKKAPIRDPEAWKPYECRAERVTTTITEEVEVL